ncbi:MAG TPA: TVP38/TMEM64 family protein [Bacillota bacterium]|nr:TVP38/TMEM64 family protein [Bacillota bacterium]
MSDNARKWIVRTAVIAVLILAYFMVPGLKEQVDQAAGILASADIKGMKEYLQGFGIWGPIVSMSLMVLQALAAPLPAFVITFANAWIWGWVWGAIISWSGAMIGAVICFYLARWFGRPLVEHMVGKKALQMSDRFFARYGRFAVLIARLIPVVSFDLVSYAGGLTNMTLWEFFWTTGLGQLPATIVYSILGENITSGAKYGLWVFCGVASLLVLSFIIKKKLEGRLREEGEFSGS